MKSLLLTWLIFATSSFQSGNWRNDEALITWENYRPLTWNDFIADIDESSPYDAWTWSGINYTYTWKNESGNIVVALDAFAFFDPLKSWVKQDLATEELLAHEQLHFDISEMYCRRFENAIKAFSFTENVEMEVDSIYQAHFNQLLAAQTEYDELSDHHANQQGQAYWEKYVHDELSQP